MELLKPSGLVSQSVRPSVCPSPPPCPSTVSTPSVGVDNKGGHTYGRTD